MYSSETHTERHRLRQVIYMSLSSQLLLVFEHQEEKNVEKSELKLVLDVCISESRSEQVSPSVLALQGPGFLRAVQTEAKPQNKICRPG